MNDRGRWHSVSDRLPDDDGEVLVILQYNNKRVRHIGHWNGVYWFTEGVQIRSSDYGVITHW